MSRVFPSKFDNKDPCPSCGRMILKGDMVFFDNENRVTHEKCPPPSTHAPSVAPPLPPSPLAGAREELGPGSWTLEFTQGSLLVRRAFLRNAPPTSTEIQEFRDFTRSAVQP